MRCRYGPTRLQGRLEGAKVAIDGPTLPVKAKQVVRPLSQQSTYFTPPALNQGDAHLIVAGSVMSKPRDGGRCSALLNRDALGAGDRAAAYGSGVRHNQRGETFRIGRMRGMKGEKREHGRAEVCDVIGLGDGAPGAGRVEFAVMSRIGALDQKFSAYCGDAMSGSPDAKGESLAAFHFGHGPRRPIGFDAPTQRAIAGWQELPAGRDGFKLSACVDHVAGFLAGTDFTGGVGHERGDKGLHLSSSRNLRPSPAARKCSLRAGVGGGRSAKVAV